MNASVDMSVRPYRSPRTQWLVCNDVVPPVSATPAANSTIVPENVSDWRAVHVHMITVGKSRAAQARELCRWLLAAERLRVHVKAGYASLREYAQRVLDLTPRQTEERLRVGHALPLLPRLEAALSAGELCWSAVRELTRIATVDTEQAWLSWAKERTSREIEQAVAMRGQGDEPATPPDRKRERHVLRFEVNAETMALFRDLQSVVRHDMGGAVDDDTMLHEIARRALAGPSDEGRAGYQMAVVRCDDCRQVSVDAGGEQHVVQAHVAQMMACDSQYLGRVESVPAGPVSVESGLVQLGPVQLGAMRDRAATACTHAEASASSNGTQAEGRGNTTACVVGLQARALARSGETQARERADAAAYVASPHAGGLARSAESQVNMMACMASLHVEGLARSGETQADVRADAAAYVASPHAGGLARSGETQARERADAAARTESAHAGASASLNGRQAEARGNTTARGAGPHAGASAMRLGRATQTIPPAIRRLVMRRDRRCCVVPGCRNHVFLDVHHLDPRAEGGSHNPERLVVLCGSHHRAVHAGTLHISGTASARLLFQHADGTPYGGAFTPARVEAAQRVRTALMSMGFKETAARALADRALKQSNSNDVPALLREALRAS